MARGMRVKLGSSEATMSLAHQVREQIRRYLAEDISLYELRLWLSLPENVQAISTSSDQAVHDLTDRALLLVSELDYGHRNEPEVRKVLTEALRSRALAS
jgi:hypothetical protein